MGIEQRVHPTMIPKTSTIAHIDGVLNAISVEADGLDSIMLIGPGAGGEATASSLLSDTCDIARGDYIPPLGMCLKDMSDYPCSEMQCHEGGYYVRLSVYDRLGTFASLAQCMTDQGISLKSIVQNSPETNENASQTPKVMSECHSPSPSLKALDGSSDELSSEIQTIVLVTHKTTEKAIRTAFEAIESKNVLADTPYMIRIEHFI